MKSKIISLTAIASAFVTIILTIGCFVEFVDLLSLVIAPIFVILPLYNKSYKGCFLCYLCGGLLALICSFSTITFSVVIPSYFFFFGIYPIIKNILLKYNVNKYVSMIVGLVWCIAAVYGLYFYYTLIIGLTFNEMPSFISNNIILFVGFFGVAFFFIFDKYIFSVKRFLDKYLAKILK